MDMETPFLLFGGLETYRLGRLGVSLIKSLAIRKLGAAAESSRVEHPGEVCTKTTREAVQRLEDALYNVDLSHPPRSLYGSSLLWRNPDSLTALQFNSHLL